jgi:GAF domain-containing protein
MLQQCAEAVVRHFDAAFARVWLVNEADNTLELYASAGMYTNLDGPYSRVPIGKLEIGYIASTGEAQLSNDLLENPQMSDKEWVRREGMIAFAGHPLIAEGRVIGVLAPVKNGCAWR